MSTLAAIDVGSQAVRLSIVRLSPLGDLVDEEFNRWPLRLGADTFAFGRIRRAREQALLATFHRIAVSLRQAGVDDYQAVATSAVRDAANGRRLLERVHRQTAIRVRLIDGNQEGRLARDALLRALGSLPAGTLLVDLGGGSLEARRLGSSAGRSLPLGTVRLLEEMPELRRPLTPDEVEVVVHRLAQWLRQALRGRGTPLAVGTGGCLDILAQLSPLRAGFHPTIDMRQLPTLTRRIAIVPAAERVRRFSLRPDRADVILPAALVIEALGRVFELKALVVPGTGIREALLRELAVRHQDRAWRRLGKHVTRLNCQQRREAALAEQLFQLLRPLHRLWPAGRVPLRAAALFGDRQPAITAADPFAAAIAAVAATGVRALRRLPVEHQRGVLALAGLLRLARALAAVEIDEVVADLTTTPVRLRAGLAQALPAKTTRLWCAAVGHRLVVR